MRFGVIGSNVITDRLLKAAKLCDDFALSTVYSRSLERAREYAGIHGAPHFTSSLDQLAESLDLDAVYIASPTALHYSQAMRMVEGGKHVLCEKPFTSNGRELDKLLDLAARRKVCVMEAIRPGFTPGLGRLQELLGKIGPVRRATLSLCKYSSRYDSFLAGKTPNAFDPRLSNSALMDLGVYPVHVMLRLFGPPTRIQSGCVKLENGFEGAGSILAEYGDKIVDLKYAKISDDHRHCGIEGEGGSIYFKDCITLSEIKVAYRGEDTPKPLPFPTLEDDMAYEISAFIGFAGGREGLAEQHRYSIETMRILDEARRQCGVRFPADD